MREIFSFIFDKITGPLTLPIEPFYEWVVFGVIGLIAHAAAFCIVGAMYKSGSIRGKFLGILFYFIIHLLIFVTIWFVVYWVIVIAQWIMAHWILALCIFIGLVTVIATLIWSLAKKSLCKRPQ